MHYESEHNTKSVKEYVELLLCINNANIENIHSNVHSYKTKQPNLNYKYVVTS